MTSSADRALSTSKHVDIRIDITASKKRGQVRKGDRLLSRWELGLGVGPTEAVDLMIEHAIKGVVYGLRGLLL